MKNKNTVTVESLRKSGYCVKIHHSRRFIPVTKLTPLIGRADSNDFKNGRIETQRIDYKVSSKGGETYAEVESADGKFYRSNTICSKNDYFNKRRSVAIVLGRIAEQMKEDGVI